MYRRYQSLNVFKIAKKLIFTDNYSIHIFMIGINKNKNKNNE